jgi:hypothetical protein
VPGLFAPSRDRREEGGSRIRDGRRRDGGSHLPTGLVSRWSQQADFNTVDVRTTRETPYDQHQYVTSDLNPDIVFIGSELEFNPMTKYFYTDRSLPKKKLSEADMIEINRLYRIIGRCETQSAELQK